ncbi:Hypothetical protein CINCED_3A022633 [Cinara cedri]|uniref:Helitron helicase-like domain-containing protein n=1 Tax=Cinara cedri TaxID=506608 RepID=A0A5E4NNS4_9HEMI|nr:Hypothetical protein CINCED_3A022633 [Cinara cedri]
MSLQKLRLNRSAEDQLTDNENLRNQAAITRTNESQEQRNERRRANALRQRLTHQRVTDTFRTPKQQRLQVYRAFTRVSLLRLAFEYEPDIDHSSHSQIVIGVMNKQCQHCHALKYLSESAGFCCTSGKVVLPPLNLTPDPLKALLAGAKSQSKLFLRKIHKFNSCFQMTSFGATKIVQNADGRNFQSTFKIQGQVYHQIGSLMPMSDSDSKCLQIYFMDNEEQQINARCQYNHIEQMEEREIMSILESFFTKSQPVGPFFRYRFKQTTKRQLYDRHQTRKSTIWAAHGPIECTDH